MGSEFYDQFFEKNSNILEMSPPHHQLNQPFGDLEIINNDNDTFVSENTTLPTILSRDESLVKFEVLTLTLSFALNIVGNSIVLIGIFIRKQKMSRMYHFIVHLCLADLITAFLHVLPQIFWELTWRFRGGNIMCKVIKYLQLIGPYSSSYVLVMTAIDRYMAICYPLSNCSYTSKRSRIMLGIAWIFSLLFSIPQIFIFSLTEISPSNSLVQVWDCWANFSTYGDFNWAKIYVLWYGLAVFIIPLMILIFAYVNICRAIWINVYLKNATQTKEKSGHDYETENNYSLTVAADNETELVQISPIAKHCSKNSTKILEIQIPKSANGKKIEGNFCTTTAGKTLSLKPLTKKSQSKSSFLSESENDDEHNPYQNDDIELLELDPLVNDENMTEISLESPKSRKNQVQITSNGSLNSTNTTIVSQCTTPGGGHFIQSKTNDTNGRLITRYKWLGKDQNNEDLLKGKVEDNEYQNLPSKKSKKSQGDSLSPSPSPAAFRKTKLSSTNSCQSNSQVSVNKKVRSVVENSNLAPRISSVKGISRAKVKTVKLTVTIIFFYILCSTPFILAQLWSTFDPDASSSPFYTGLTFTIVTLLASLNSVVNPWIFLLFNPNLLQNFIKCFSPETEGNNRGHTVTGDHRINRRSTLNTRNTLGNH